jgi:hypothetical protein
LNTERPLGRFDRSAQETIALAPSVSGHRTNASLPGTSALPRAGIFVLRASLTVKDELESRFASMPKAERLYRPYDKPIERESLRERHLARSAERAAAPLSAAHSYLTSGVIRARRFGE